MTVARVRLRHLPVHLAALLVEPLQRLPHFVRAAAAAQLQVLPVELQGGAGVLYAVVGLHLDVEVWGQGPGNTGGDSGNSGSETQRVTIEAEEQAGRGAARR